MLKLYLTKVWRKTIKAYLFRAWLAEKALVVPVIALTFEGIFARIWLDEEVGMLKSKHNIQKCFYDVEKLPARVFENRLENTNK